MFFIFIIIAYVALMDNSDYEVDRLDVLAPLPTTFFLSVSGFPC